MPNPAFLTFPDKFQNKQLVFQVDNTAVLWGWKSGFVSKDDTASEVLKCVRYLSGYLGARVFIEHVGRMSTEMASLADEMSRREISLSETTNRALRQAEFRVVKGFLLNWLKNPCAGWDLCNELLKEMNV